MNDPTRERELTTRPEYVYVASSWRNPVQPAVVATLTAAGIDCYDFRNPPEATGFSWREVRPGYDGTVHATELRVKGADWEPADRYLEMIEHPRAREGFASEFAAMERADTFVLVLPCGKSAHLELGWAVGAGKRTAILLEDPIEPELMYRMCDYLAPSLFDLLGWLGVADDDGPPQRHMLGIDQNPASHEFVGYAANPTICAVCGAVRPMPCYEIGAPS